MIDLKKIKFALEKLPEDIRDFSHHKVFGTITPLNIPTVGFDVSPLPAIILDQIDLDFCSAFASTELNTYFDLTNISLIDYLNSKGQNSTLSARADLAVKYKIAASVVTYISSATLKNNSSMNLQILSNLMKDNGDYFDPLFFMSKIKQIRGEYKAYGANVRDACNAAVTYGFIRKNQSPFTYNENKTTDKTRDFLANWLNWPKSLDVLAAINRLGSFFAVDGPYDAFDNFRSALYKNYQTGVNCGILFGLNWRPEWTYMAKGMIVDNYTLSLGDGHMVYLRGVTYFNGIPYIKMQQSWGKDIGDNGIFYLPRNVINAEFAANYGAFILKKLSKMLASYYNDNNLQIGSNWLMEGVKLSWSLIKNLFIK